MNRDPSFRWPALLLTLFAGCAIACASESSSLPEGLPEGINDQFLSETLDVGKFVERFEGESREVYAGRHAIVSALGLSEGSAIADIGAGTGFFSLLFVDQVGEQGSVHAVEVSPRFLEHLRALSTRDDLSRLRVVEGTMTSVELPNASVDLAFLCDVYHHFESPPATLASLHAAIRPGGSLVLIDFERIPGKSPKRLLEHVRAGKQVFREEIEEAGFELEEEIQLEALTNNYMLRFRRIDPKLGVSDDRP